MPKFAVYISKSIFLSSAAEMCARCVFGNIFGIFFVFLKITNTKIGAVFKIRAGGDDQLVIFFFTWPNIYSKINSFCSYVGFYYLIYTSFTRTITSS